MIDTFKRYIQNIPGTRTNRKLIVIESDDWGSILMPNKKTFDNLHKMGFEPEKKAYLCYDALASEDDLSALFETLNSVKDKNNNPATLTANCVLANPDFEAIKNNNFSSYIWEPFTDTLKKYPKHSNAFNLWKEGIQNNIFIPQYHGREHLNVYQWMKGLQANDEKLLKAFDLRMITINSQQNDKRFSYMAGLDFYSKAEQESKAKILKEGLEIFTKSFGYSSKSFIANCYVWDKSSEKTLSSLNIKLIQGMLNQIQTKFKKDGTTYQTFKKHYFGEKNEFNQRYLIRNVYFEPSLEPNKDWISDCLKRIEIAFKCRKPAIICSHRLNYIGYIQEQNRKSNLKILRQLLFEIKKRWPDVEFVSTPELEKIF